MTGCLWWPRVFLAFAGIALLAGTPARAVSLQDCKQNQKGYGNAAEHDLDMPPDLIASLVQIALDGAAGLTDQAVLAERAAHKPVDDPQDPFPWTTHTYVLLEGCFARVRLAELQAAATSAGESQNELGDWAPATPAGPVLSGRNAGAAVASPPKPGVELTHCLKTETFGQGKQCGDPTSYSVKVTNVCSAMIEAEVCFKRLDGTANCGRESNLATGASHDFWGCDLTRTYKYLGCEHWKTRKESCSMMRANGPFIDD